MDDENFVDLDLDFLRESCYWIVSKFREDDFHQQQSSSRRDLIGGFFDRWINKTHELIIFDQLLKKNSSEPGQYSVVNDSFFYGQGTKKDAPDVIGLRNNHGKIVPFALFDNGSWELNKGCPHVEVKTFRSNQYLVTIPENQYDDDHYYVIMNSHVRPDYLISLFDEDKFFNEKYFNNIQSNSDEIFLKNKNDKKIIHPEKLEKNINVGKYELLGIFKGKDIKKFSRNLEMGIKPLYLQKVTKSPNWNSTGVLDNPFELNTGFYIFKENEDKSKDIILVDFKKLNEINEPGILFYIDIPEKSKATVKKIIKDAMDIEVEGKIIINGEPIKDGMYRLNIGKFNRTGNKKEYVSSKDTLKCFATSSQKELIDTFDNIYKKYLID